MKVKLTDLSINYRPLRSIHEVEFVLETNIVTPDEEVEFCELFPKFIEQTNEKRWAYDVLNCAKVMNVDIVSDDNKPILELKRG